MKILLPKLIVESQVESMPSVVLFGVPKGGVYIVSVLVAPFSFGGNIGPAVKGCVVIIKVNLL